MKFKIPKNQKKELFLSLTIIVIGNLLGIGMFLQENVSSSAQALPRKDFGQGAYEETLKISTDRGTEEIQITVGEQQYSSSQIQAYLREAHSFLSKWYLENISDTNCLRKDWTFPLLSLKTLQNFSGAQMPRRSSAGMENWEKKFLKKAVR